MFAVSGPVTRTPSACRGDATNSIPKRLASKRIDIDFPIAGNDQPGALRCGKAPVLCEADRVRGAGGSTLAAEDAAAEIERRAGGGHVQRTGRTNLDAASTTG